MSEGAGWLDDKKCPVCGKRFTVLYPNLWRYRTGYEGRGTYFCSWDCLRHKEEAGMERKITDSQKKRAVEIAMKGGDPLDYLKQCGSKNPSAHWYMIKKQLLKKDPERYERLLKKAGKAEVQVADRLPEEARPAEPQVVAVIPDEEQPVELVYDEGILEEYRMEQELKAKAKGPEKIDGIEPLEVASLFSRVIDGARFKKIDGGMALQSEYMNLRLTAYEWFRLTEEILVAIRQLDAAKPNTEG